ncbi:MAG: 30S ribosomal protein S16 [Candidatus Pacebacteria bacterium]|nr:30S ribosomal protein S16 [Candidatus Paceibacterota bacterium]
MLKIRLQRVGRKHEPVFRVVITDSRNSTKSGRFHEIVGSFDARKKGFGTLNKERVEYWLSQGVQPTPRVHNLLIDEKIIEGKKINVLSKKTPIIKEAPEEETASSAEPVATPEAATETPAAPVEEKKEEPVLPADEPNPPAGGEEKAV